MDKAVVLLSGGLDSVAALALVQERSEVVLCLTVDYGQRAAQAEERAAAACATHYGLRHQTVELPFFAALGGSALTDPSRQLPRPGEEDLEAGGAVVRDSADRVWVPNRNGVLVQVAAAFAEAHGAQLVVVGFNAEEAATFPDNSQGFLAACDAALRFSTRESVRMTAPTADWDKAEILRQAARRGAPLEHLWPCYDGGEMPCGTCESCARLLRASRITGIRVPRAPFDA